MQKAGQTDSLNPSIVGSRLYFSEFFQGYGQLQINRLGILALSRLASADLVPIGMLRQPAAATLDLQIALQVPLYPVVQIFLHGEGPRF